MGFKSTKHIWPSTEWSARIRRRKEHPIKRKEGTAIGTDATNKVCLKDIGPVHPTSKTLKDACEGKIAKGSTLTHDSLHGYQGVFESSNPKKENWINSQKHEEEVKLDHINQLCSGVKWFLRQHHGIRRRISIRISAGMKYCSTSIPVRPNSKAWFLAVFYRRKPELMLN